MNLAIHPDRTKTNMHPIYWGMLEPWLVTGEYAQLARVLQQLQRQIPNENPLQRVTQSAASLSLACEHLQLEAHLRQQACVEINGHLHSLGEQLRAIVQLLASNEMLSSGEDQDPLLEITFPILEFDLEPSTEIQPLLASALEPAIEPRADVTEDPSFRRQLHRLAYGGNLERPPEPSNLCRPSFR